MAWGDAARGMRGMNNSPSSPPLQFPSTDEVEAADSLVLLNFSLLPTVMATTACCRSSSASCFSDSHSDEDSSSHSSIVDPLILSEPVLKPQFRPDNLGILSVAASLHLTDTKVVQLVAHNLIHQTSVTTAKRKRSTVTSVIPIIDLTSEETATNSDLCSASSSITTASVPAKAPPGVRRMKKKKCTVVPRSQPRLWRCAQDIEEFLMAAPGMVVTEAEIRKAIGNGPDTSKALRMLVKQDEVKRLGTGGKNHPYLYMLNRYIT